MSALVNKPFPAKDYSFLYVPIVKGDTSVKMPEAVEWSKFISENKCVVITGAPAAFSPTCTDQHIPGYVSNLEKFLNEKKVDQVVVLTADNPFANKAWAKSLGVQETKQFKFATDPGLKFIKSIGYEFEFTPGVFWSGRWAIVVKDGVVTYAEIEKDPVTQVTVSSADAVLKHL